MLKRFLKINWKMLGIFIVILGIAMACQKSESPVEVVSNDMTKPEPPFDIEIENLNGASKITYKLPKSPNMLYVLAQYEIREGHSRESKTSIYGDSLRVEGFHKEGEYDVKLYTVSRANVRSEPIVIKVHPKTPNYILVNENLQISPDFGGANFNGINPDGEPISIHLMAFNSQKGKFDELEPEYIHGKLVDVSIRGYDPIERQFAVYTSDRFGNVSEPRYTKLTPLFEKMLDKSQFFVYRLPSDAPIGHGWDLKYLFDGSLNDPGWHTTTAPVTVGTFGIGQSAKISRFVLWNRLPQMFSDQNPKSITIWGSNIDNPKDIILPHISQPGDVLGDWINMGNFTYPDPPSGLPGNQANASDNAFAAAGINFKMPSIAPVTKYIRFQVNQTWSGLKYTNAMEISLYGSNE